jgi:hypothetical protein
LLDVVTLINVMSLRRLLFGPGRLPEPLRSELLADDPLIFEEGLFGSVTRRNYRAPGIRTNIDKRAVSAAVAVTATRVVVWAGRMKHIDVPRDHPMWAAIEVVAETPDRVAFTYNAGWTNTMVSGMVTVRVHTTSATRIAELHPIAPN